MLPPDCPNTFKPAKAARFDINLGKVFINRQSQINLGKDQIHPNLTIGARRAMGCGNKSMRAWYQVRQKQERAAKSSAAILDSQSVKTAADGKMALQRLFAQIKHNVHNQQCRPKVVWADGAIKIGSRLCGSSLAGHLTLCDIPKPPKDFRSCRIVRL